MQMAAAALTVRYTIRDMYQTVPLTDLREGFLLIQRRPKHN